MYDFKSYDDPVKARRVWNEYVADIKARGGLSDAEVALGESTRVDQLDCKLDSLFTRLRQITIEDQFPGHIDWDATGTYANAARAVEESR